MSLVSKIKQELGEYLFGIESIKSARQEEALFRELYPKELLPSYLVMQKRDIRNEYLYQYFVNLVRLGCIADLVIAENPYILIANEFLRVVTYLHYHPKHQKQRIESIKKNLISLSRLEDESEE